MSDDEAILEEIELLTELMIAVTAGTLDSVDWLHADSS